MRNFADGLPYVALFFCPFVLLPIFSFQHANVFLLCIGDDLARVKVPEKTPLSNVIVQQKLVDIIHHKYMTLLIPPKFPDQENNGCPFLVQSKVWNFLKYFYINYL